MHLKLTRFAYLKDCTVGRLNVGGTLFFTIEKPWAGNQAFGSCIPEGFYHIERYSSAKFRDAFEVVDVPERSKILLHRGNTADDVSGCIAIGELHTIYNDQHRVTQSRLAFERLKRLVGNNDLTLTITHFSAVLDND